MHTPSSKLFLFTALTGVLLVPALSFAGPNGNHGQRKQNKRHYKQTNGQFKQGKRANRGTYATNRRVKTQRQHARRTVASHRYNKRQRRQRAYRAPAPRRTVHVRRHAPLARTRTFATTRYYTHPATTGFRGNSASLLRRAACRTSAVRYPSGRLAAAGKCRRGLKRGTWTAYDRRGRTVASAQFRRGVRLSSWTRHNGHGHKVYRQGRRYGKVNMPRRVRVQPLRTVHHPRQRVRIAYNAR